MGVAGMTDEAEAAKAAVEALWLDIEDNQRQALYVAVSRAASAGVSVHDILEWLDACTYADLASD